MPSFDKSARKQSLSAPQVVVPRLSVEGQTMDDPNSRLKEMGYNQELRRSMGMISVLGLSCAIMAVPFGTSTSE